MHPRPGIESECMSLLLELWPMANLVVQQSAKAHGPLVMFSLCHHVTFYNTLTSLSTVFIKPHVGLLQLLKWPCRTSFFTHVEPLNTQVFLASDARKDSSTKMVKMCLRVLFRVDVHHIVFRCIKYHAPSACPILHVVQVFLQQLLARMFLITL